MQVNLIWRHFANAYNDSPTNGRVIQELLMWAWSSLARVYKMCSAGCQVNTSPPPSVAATVLPRSAPTLNPVLTSRDHQRSSRHRGNCISESSLQAICCCEAQARVRQGSARIGKEWPLRRKALKLEPLPRAYIKVGCHHHPTNV